MNNPPGHPCPQCGAIVLPTGRRGRPRKWCPDCTPPGSGAETARRWRQLNPDGVAEQIRRRYRKRDAAVRGWTEAHNEALRRSHRERQEQLAELSRRFREEHPE